MDYDAIRRKRRFYYIATRGGSWSPSALFRQSEPGVWYDPSDFSTMFQDTAGTTPVTATGQSVALMLDKSKGLVLGPELVTNGDFSGGTTASWSSSNSTISVVSGALRMASQSASPASTIQSIGGLVVGRTYVVTATYWQGGTGGTAARVSFFGTNSQNNSTSTPVTVSFMVVASATSASLSLQSFGTASTESYFDNISVKELPGNHATQSSLSSRPILQQDANGKYFLLFDGSDDFLVTGTITPGTDKAQVFAGVRKLSDAGFGVVVELSAAIASNNGAFSLYGNIGVGYTWQSKGTAAASANANALGASPITNVLTGIGDIAADTAIIRANGSQAASSTTDQGTGNYLAYPLYIGRRGGTSLPYNGRLYGLVTRFGANLTDSQISRMERWMNGKTGAY